MKNKVDLLEILENNLQGVSKNCLTFDQILKNNDKMKRLMEDEKYSIAETRDPQNTCNAKSSKTKVKEAYPMPYLLLISEQTK